ncbi:MAG: (d)CMP kinase [Atopobiaceae bacterium]|nr:(d)CMP kinase [Atopobiaceae bacterium]
MKVAIDGPAGSGKSTIAHLLAERCGLVLLDTGAMYRSVTLACHEGGVDVNDAEAVARVSQEITIAFGTAEDGTQTVALNGRDVTAAIRTPEIDADVSAVSAVPAVREAMVAQQRAMGETGDVVAEGRDIGTVVFPDAEVKVFLTANPEARAHRRALQRSITDEEKEAEILQDLKRRDKADSTREVAPLRPAEDAVHIDSSSMTIEEEVAQISELIRAVRAGVDGTPAEQADGAQFATPTGKDEDVQVELSARQTDDGQEEAPQLKDEAQSGKPLSDSVADGDDKPKKHAKKKEEKPEDPNDKFYDGDMHKFSLGNRFLLGAAICVCGAVSKVFWPWVVEGGEKLWNAEGGQMVIMNHVSMLDPVVIAVSDWAHGRRLRPIYKSEFDKSKIINWFFARVGAIPVKRGTADVKAVRRAQRALQRGEDILVFPEGTRIHSEDQEVEIHGGFALMAQLAKVPVIPIAIVGARDGTPGGNKPLRPGRMWMRVGDAITFDELGVKGRKKQASAMEKVAMERVYALRDALRAAHPGKM